MSTKLKEPQNVRAAYATGKDRFCIAVHELRADDPFTIILEYDGQFSQPWTRVEVKRNISDITARPDLTGNDNPFVAVSDEGDVYFIETGVPTEKIPGAGIYSEDADGSGSIEGITFVDGQLFAFGSGGQLYKRVSDQTWQRVRVADDTIARQGRFSALARAAKGALYAVGTIVPAYWRTPEDIEKAQLEAAAAGDLKRFEELNAQAERWAKDKGFQKVSNGFLLAQKDDDWKRIETGTDDELRDIFVESTQQIWIVGGSGTILTGNLMEGFRNVAFHGDSDKSLVSVTRFNGRIVIASGYALHWFDGHILSPLKPVLDPSINGNVPTPLKVQAVDDVLYYFDYKHGVHKFDGTNWTQIKIPPELLQREFGGASKP